MYKSSVINILSSFSPEEIKEFGYFVSSPFFNRNHALINLFGYLRKQYPSFKEAKLDRRKVYKAVFKKTVYNDAFMRVLISNLTKLAEEYLTQVYFRKQVPSKKISLLYELNLRKLVKSFKHQRNEIEKMFGTMSENDMWFYHYKALLEDNLLFFNSWFAGSRKKSRSSAEKSQKAIVDNFTKFYLIASMSMYRRILHIKSFGKVDVDLKFTHEVINILETFKKEFSDTEIINLIMSEILLFTKGENKYFDTLKKIYTDSSSKLSHVDYFNLMNILNKYSVIQIYNGKFHYRKERFMIYKTANGKGIIVHPYLKKIEKVMFISIIESAIQVNNLEWAKDFINKNKHLLADDDKESVTNICMAMVEFEKGEFTKSRELIEQIKTKHTEISIRIKITFLKIYYELQMYIEAEMMMDTFRHLLPKAEKTFSLIVFESYKNFLKYYASLIKAHEKSQPDKAKEVLKQLRKEFCISDRSWLIEKTRAILK